MSSSILKFNFVNQIQDSFNRPPTIKSIVSRTPEYKGVEVWHYI